MRVDSSLESCPVSDELLGALYRAGPPGAVEATSALPLAQRASLAVFCYARAHLHEIGLAIAATCDPASLVEVAGKAGHALYAQARNRAHVPALLPTVKKRAISLATFAPMRPFTVIEGGLAAAE
jgi:hypothetical protein